MAQATHVHPTATRNAFHDRGSTAKMAGLAKACDSGFSIGKLPQRRVNHMFRTGAAPELGRLEGGVIWSALSAIRMPPEETKADRSPPAYFGFGRRRLRSGVRQGER